MEAGHPEARCRTVNPYHTDYSLSQEPLPPLPLPATQPEFKLPVQRKPRVHCSKKRPDIVTRLPRSAKELYPFLE